jgi:hypothetical protein
MENGHTLGGPEIVEALDQYYGTGGMLLTLWELAVADPTRFKERYRRYMVLEAEAVSMCGLAGVELERQVAARMGRREPLLAEGGPQFRALLSETVLHSSLRNAADWYAQLRHLVAMGERPNISVQVVPWAAGLHALTNTHTMFLHGAGRIVAWVETGYSGELVQETTAVDQLQLRYDRVRDAALTPGESRRFIERMLEEAPCEPSI